MIQIKFGILMLLPLFISGSQNEQPSEPKTEVSFLTSRQDTKPKKITVTGGKAFSLVSLLASGSSEAAEAISKTSRIVIHDLEVSRASTYKIDSDNAMSELDLYGAIGKIGDAKEETTIGEATSLWGLLASIGFKAELSLGHSSYEIAVMDCKVDVKHENDVPERFKCEITGKY